MFLLVSQLSNEALYGIFVYTGSMGRKLLFILLGGLAVLLGSVLIISAVLNRETTDDITTYEGCVVAGYPVQESHPARCVMPGNKSFTQPVSRQEQPITVEGTVICLLHKDTDGPQTLECAAGLRTEDGKYYSIHADIPDGTSLTGAAGNNRKVKVSGILKEEGNTRYQSEGAVTVHSFEFVQ